jgi:hypothetical protein
VTETDEGDVLERHRHALCSFLKTQVQLIDQCLAELANGKLQQASAVYSDLEVVDTVIMMVQGIGVSVRSILKLSETLDMSLRDCLSISRSVVETSINVAYIVAGGSQIATQARRHALQKSYRDLERSGKLGRWVFNVSSGNKPEISSIPGLQIALGEFSDSNGRERRDWTKDNLEKRLNLIEQKFPDASLDFATAIMQIYRHSSEILHGTYFGTVYFWQSPVGARVQERTNCYTISSPIISWPLLVQPFLLKVESSKLWHDGMALRRFNCKAVNCFMRLASMSKTTSLT